MEINGLGLNDEIYSHEMASVFTPISEGIAYTFLIIPQAAGT